MRKRAIWINIPFSNITFTETVGTQQLLVPEDWEAQYAGVEFEKATLRCIVGQLMIQHTTAGTLGGHLWWIIYMMDSNATTPTAFTGSGLSEIDILRSGVRATASTVTATALQGSNVMTEDINIKAKRKMTSRDGIFISAGYSTDAGSPAGAIGGMLRFLVARD